MGGSPVVACACDGLEASEDHLINRASCSFPALQFVVGYDTAIRLVMPKYYSDSYTRMVWGDNKRLRIAKLRTVMPLNVRGQASCPWIPGMCS